MLLVEDPDAANVEDKGDNNFRATWDAEYRLDTGLTKLTRHIRTKRWRRHPSFNPNEVQRVADELSKMKRGAPVPDRFELVEVTEPIVPPTVIEAPKVSLGRPTPSAHPSTTAPTSLHTTPSTQTPLRVNTTLPPTNTSSAAPANATPSAVAPSATTPATPSTSSTKFVFKFGAKKTSAQPAAESGAAATPSVGTASSAPPPTLPTAQTPMRPNVPLSGSPLTSQATPSITPASVPYSNPNAMDVDRAPSATPVSASAPSATASSTIAPGSEMYEAKLAQRADLARRKVAEQALLAKNTTSLQDQKNQLLRKRMEDAIKTHTANIAKFDAQIAALDRELGA